MRPELTFEECRVIGSLIEKRVTTPEYYPMTINALMNACNQKSSREPVVQFSEDDVERVVLGLRNKQLVLKVTGADIRVPKYRECFTERLGLEPEAAALLCVLMLRGAQTVGELKGRTGRMHQFASIAATEESLEALCSGEEPLVLKLPRTGRVDSRYAHLFSGEPAPDTLPVYAAPADDGPSELQLLQHILAEVQALRADVDALKKQFEG